MAKLQSIKRSNGSIVYSVNIPIGLIEEKGWDKGDDLIIYSSDNDSIKITKN